LIAIIFGDKDPMKLLLDEPEIRVCIISSYPPAKDGVAHYCVKLSQAMVSVSSKLLILVLSNENNVWQDHRLKVEKVWSENSIFYPFRVFRVMAEWKPEVIHVQHEYSLYGRGIYSITFPLLLLILQFLKRPVVVTMHHAIPREELSSVFFHKHNYGRYFTTIKGFYVTMYTKLIGLLSSKIIVHLKVAKNMLMEDYAFKKNKVLVLPHGLYTYSGKISVNKTQAKEYLDVQNQKVVLFFGEIRRGKGLEYAIKAMPKISAKNPQSVFVIAGRVSPENRSYLEELKDLSESLGLEGKVIHRAQFIADGHVPYYFAAADIVLLPYTKDEIVAASGPLSTALAYSKPIVATRIKSFTDLKDRENALLVPPADSDNLANAVNTLLNDNELRRMLSEGTKSIVNGKTWEDIALKTLTLYKQVCNKASLKS